MSTAKPTPGITARHRKTCPHPRADGRCCKPSYRAEVFDHRAAKKIRRTFPTLAAAKRWRQDAIVDVRNGVLRQQRTATVRQIAETWLADAERGVVTNRSGDRYKPSAIRAYRQSLRLRVVDEIGDRQFSDITRGDLQRLIDRLVAQGLSPSTVQCSLLPLRAMYRRAISLDEIAVNPTTGLRLPAIRGGRDTIVTPAQATALIEALPTPHDRALWGTALYAGLRRGELLGLMWADVDISAGQIHVTRSWDVNEGHDVGPKSAVGRRKVPIASRLKALLAAHRLAGRSTGLVFGENGTRAASPAASTKRADDAWTAAKLDRITLHEARHTYASLMIAAGVNAKALSTYMGHSNISSRLTATATSCPAARPRQPCCRTHTSTRRPCSHHPSGTLDAMAEFPSIRAKDLLKILEREPLNYRVVRQSGSHRRMKAPGRPTITFAFHDKRSLAPSEVRAVLVKDVGLADDEALGGCPDRRGTLTAIPAGL